MNKTIFLSHKVVFTYIVLLSVAAELGRNIANLKRRASLLYDLYVFQKRKAEKKLLRKSLK